MTTAMSPIDWAKRPLQKFADFSGRAPRSEYWWFVLGVVIVSALAAIIDNALGVRVFADTGPLSLLVGLGLLVPSLAVAVRRLHDTNRTGWWVLLPLIPYVLGVILGRSAMTQRSADPGAALSSGNLGLAAVLLLLAIACALVLLFFYCQRGTIGDNRFGPNPLGGQTIIAD